MTNHKPTHADNHCGHAPTRMQLSQGWICAHCGTPVEIVPREVMGEIRRWLNRVSSDHKDFRIVLEETRDGCARVLAALGGEAGT